MLYFVIYPYLNRKTSLVYQRWALLVRFVWNVINNNFYIHAWDKGRNLRRKFVDNSWQFIILAATKLTCFISRIVNINSSSTGTILLSQDLILTLMNVLSWQSWNKDRVYLALDKLRPFWRFRCNAGTTEKCQKWLLWYVEFTFFASVSSSW